MGCLGLLCCSDIFLPCCCLVVFGDSLSCARASLACVVSLFPFAVLGSVRLHLPVVPLSVNEPLPCDCYHTLLQGFHEGVLETDLCCAWLILDCVFWELLKEENELKLRGEYLFVCDWREMCNFLVPELLFAKRGKVQLNFFCSGFSENPAELFLCLRLWKLFSPYCSGRMIAQSYLNGERAVTNADFFLCQVHVGGVLVSQHSSQPEQVVLSQLSYKPCVRHRDLQVIDWNRVVK